MNLTNGEKLILAMLSDLSEHLKIQGEIDPKLVKAAIWGNQDWGLTWEYEWLFSGKTETPESVRKVVDIMEMWSVIESYYDRLSLDDNELVKKEAYPFGSEVRFPGFDGNDELEGQYMSIAQFLVEHLHRFSDFKGRDFNSHCEMLGKYERMLAAFQRIRPQIPNTPLSAAQVISLLNERKGTAV
jgi:uncharacterized protein YfbU (UPF0304 family)